DNGRSLSRRGSRRKRRGGSACADRISFGGDRPDSDSGIESARFIHLTESDTGVMDAAGGTGWLSDGSGGAHPAGCEPDGAGRFWAARRGAERIDAGG